MILLVTGCRSGFGLLTALSAARAGHIVYAGLRDVSTADALTAAADPRIHPVQLDVTDDQQRSAVVANITEEHGAIDALVNNAGAVLAGPLERIDDDEMRKLFEVNVFGLWALTNAVLPSMRDQGSGLVVNVSSMAGRMAMPCLGAYAATKHAVGGMTEALRHEVRPFGIRVVVVEPGPYATDIFARNRRVSRRNRTDDDSYAPLIDSMERLAEKAKGNAGDPQVVADTIVSLLNDPNPPPRIPMGPTARARRAARWLLSDRLFDKMVSRVVARG